ncbi:MAG: hypothetical protein H7A55_09325 [Verrucomicrobiaceae bacterium]|nr:hypothetical protein [Verrucomicrobiaceae bacterium]
MKSLFIALVALLAGFLACRWYERSYFADVAYARRLISQFGVDHDHRWGDHIGPLVYWQCHINTFSHETSSSTIRSLYEEACDAVVVAYGSKAVAYSWEDQLEYPRRALIVRHNESGPVDSYTVVQASQNNDSDGFTFAHLRGDWPETGAKVEPSWHLPEGFLHSN